MTADVVVAINGVWILVETYTLNSKISSNNIKTCVKKTLQSSLLFCRWSFLVQTCSLELYCFPDQWVGSKTCQKKNELKLLDTNIYSLVFPLLVYGVEVLLKLTGLGPMAYFSSGWNLWVFYFFILSYLVNKTFFLIQHIWIQILNVLHWFYIFGDIFSFFRFDFSVTVFAFLGLIALAFNMEPFYFIVVLKPLQLLRSAFCCTFSE